MAFDLVGWVLSSGIIITSGLLVIILTNRMRIALEIITLFILSNILLIISISVMEPQSIQEYSIIAIIPAFLILYTGFRLNYLIKSPYNSIVESSKRVWNNDLSLIEDDVALKFTGEMSSLYKIHRGLIKKFNETLTEVASSSSGISLDGQVLFHDADVIANNFDQNTDDVDKILQSIVVLSDLVDNIKSITQNFLNNVEQKFNQIGFSLSSADRLTDQTNLIAVSASIEAAHSGKEGENFGIVANSIQSLSQRSRSSTNNLIQNSKELNNLIKDQIESVESELKKIDELIYQIGELSNSSSTLNHGQQSTVHNLVKLANSIKTQADKTNKLIENVTF